MRALSCITPSSHCIRPPSYPFQHFLQRTNTYTCVFSKCLSDYWMMMQSFRNYDFGVPSSKMTFTRAVTVQAEEPKLSAESTRVQFGSTETWSAESCLQPRIRCQPAMTASSSGKFPSISESTIEPFGFFNEEVYSRRHLDSIGYHSFMEKNNLPTSKLGTPIMEICDP